MTDTTKATRRTAANTPDLARLKGLMNAPIFKRASEIYNAEGRDACKAYMGQFFNDEARERCLGHLFVD